MTRTVVTTVNYKCDDCQTEIRGLDGKLYRYEVLPEGWSFHYIGPANLDVDPWGHLCPECVASRDTLRMKQSEP